MIRMNRCRYAKERDEYIKMLEKPIRFTRGEVTSMLNFPSEKELYREWYLHSKRSKRNKRWH